MAHHKSAIKRIAKSRKENARNRYYKATMRTALKKVYSFTESSDELATAAKGAVSLLDKLVTKGIIHRNNAANKKSKLTKYVNSLA